MNRVSTIGSYASVKPVQPFFDYQNSETPLRECLVPYKIQNANYFEMIKCKMPKFSEFLVPSKIQNLLPLWEPLEALLGFCLPFKVKIQNGD